MFIVVERFDDGRVASHAWNARDFATFLMYLKPGLWLQHFKSRGIVHNFTVCDALVSVERVS